MNGGETLGTGDSIRNPHHHHLGEPRALQIHLLQPLVAFEQAADAIQRQARLLVEDDLSRIPRRCIE